RNDVLVGHMDDDIARRMGAPQVHQVDAAVAFMAGPELVLLDEPAGGVNLTMLEYLKDRLRTYNREHGATFVVIEHNMEFVMSLCTRIIVLAEGAIIAEGSPDEIKSNQQVIDAYLGG
ncbi:MAG: ABC transporter ATP-binding protein, partial [Rhizobiales bacterium]|nr:ABC transporter ATP-binding protein [Hyphomicrobiales bacterium]